jgi:hypothetical protein
MSKDRRQSPNGSFTEYTANNLPSQIQTSFSLDNIKQINNSKTSPNKPASNTYAFLSSNIDPYASPKKTSKTTLTASTSQNNVIAESSEETSLDKENLQPSSAVVESLNNRTPDHSLTASGNHANFSSTLLLESSLTSDKQQQQRSNSVDRSSANNSLSAHTNTASTTGQTATESFQTPNDSISFYSTPLNHAANTTDSTDKQEEELDDSSSNLSPIHHMNNIDSSSSSSSNLSTSNMRNVNANEQTNDIMDMINKDMQAIGSPLSSSNSRNGDESSQALVTASEG